MGVWREGFGRKCFCFFDELWIKRGRFVWNIFWLEDFVLFSFFWFLTSVVQNRVHSLMLQKKMAGKQN